jgi:predicted kinase
LAQALLRSKPARRLISTDAIRAELFGDEATQGSWLQIEREVERQFRQTVQNILRGQVTEGIYDATNVERKQRRQAIALARTCGFTHITGLWLNTPLWLCLERNRQRDRQVPEDIILKMHRCLLGAPPSLAESLDCLIEISPQFILKIQ